MHQLEYLLLSETTVRKMYQYLAFIFITVWASEVQLSVVNQDTFMNIEKSIQILDIYTRLLNKILRIMGLILIGYHKNQCFHLMHNASF